MWRGTTPVHTFSFPSDIPLGEMTAIYISYAQNGLVVLEKTIGDMVISDHQIKISLSQTDTLKFLPGPVHIQLRAKLSDGKTLASNIISTTAKEILKDGEI